MSPVDVHDADDVITIVLDSPANRNALSPALIDGIRNGLKQARETGSRCAVLTHTGNTFCAGADLSTKGKSAPADPEARLQAQQESGRRLVGLLTDILESPVPVIGHITGHVRAGGMGLVAACDHVVAGSDATFGLSEVRIGVVAAIVSTVICERIDDRTAADWFLTGRAVSAQEAASARFVTTAADDSNAAVQALVQELHRGAPSALRGTKEMLNSRILSRMATEADEMLTLSAHHFQSEDAAAGIRAFRTKSDPPWLAPHA